MITLTKIEQAIAEILVDGAWDKKTVTFTAIMQKLGIGRRKLGEYLSHIGHKCQELGLPIITVIVVYKHNKKVGKGYVEFDPNYKKNPESVANEQNKVFEQKDWGDLFDCIATWKNDIIMNNVVDTTCKPVTEGALIDRHIWVHTRDSQLREKCLNEKGKICCVCECDLAKLYGEGFENLIEVHHKNPIAGGTRKTTLEDVVPVCPNCHRALHAKPNGIYTVEELKKIITSNKI